MSLAQASLWKAYAAFGFNEIFNLPFALDFLEPVDEALYGRAFTDVLERHPCLRSLFRRTARTWSSRSCRLPSCRNTSGSGPSAESVGVDRRDEAQHHFDLAKELPFRLRFLIDPATGRQVLSFLFHHVVLDEWSVNLMMDEIAYCYRVRAAGGMPIWSDAPAPFHEFARLQAAAGVNQQHLGYWTDMLGGAPQPQPILLRQDRAEPAGEGGVCRRRLGRVQARPGRRRKDSMPSPSKAAPRCSTWSMPASPLRCASSALCRSWWSAPRPRAAAMPPSSTRSAISPPSSPIASASTRQ